MKSKNKMMLTVKLSIVILHPKTKTETKMFERSNYVNT